MSTLTSLVETGDRIVKIEGVLSGTLSYIFNNLVGSSRFSEVVGTAKRLGYTEPDPREDLSGKYPPEAERIHFMAENLASAYRHFCQSVPNHATK